MIGVTSALLAAVLLFALLLAWLRADIALRDLPSGSEEWLSGQWEEADPCPPEFVEQIFSNDDRAYVWRLDSPKLERQFRQERNGVALLWVQQTSGAVRRIMQQHVEASRQSKDIEFTTEARIFLQYAQLRVACGLLFLGIGLAGPQRLRGMALYTDELTQRIGDVLREFDAGIRAHEMKSVGSS
jgi:hypothetical protein